MYVKSRSFSGQFCLHTKCVKKEQYQGSYGDFSTHISRPGKPPSGKAHCVRWRTNELAKLMRLHLIIRPFVLFFPHQWYKNLPALPSYAWYTEWYCYRYIHNITHNLSPKLLYSLFQPSAGLPKPFCPKNLVDAILLLGFEWCTILGSIPSLTPLHKIAQYSPDLRYGNAKAVPALMAIAVDRRSVL